MIEGMSTHSSCLVKLSKRQPHLLPAAATQLLTRPAMRPGYESAKRMVCSSRAQVRPASCAAGSSNAWNSSTSTVAESAACSGKAGAACCPNEAEPAIDADTTDCCSACRRCAGSCCSPCCARCCAGTCCSPCCACCCAGSCCSPCCAGASCGNACCSSTCCGVAPRTAAAAQLLVFREGRGIHG